MGPAASAVAPAPTATATLGTARTTGTPGSPAASVVVAQDATTETSSWRLLSAAASSGSTSPA